MRMLELSGNGIAGNGFIKYIKSSKLFNKYLSKIINFSSSITVCMIVFTNLIQLPFWKPTDLMRHHGGNKKVYIATSIHGSVNFQSEL